MNRSGRMPVMAGFAVMVIVTLITGAARADRFDNIEIAVRPLADGLSMLQGAGGNVVACAAAEGVVLIDSDCAGMSEKLHAAVAGLESGAVRLVVNTHWHFDHVEGNSALKEQGAVVIAHSATRAHMSAPQHFDVPDHDTEAAPESQLPDICLEDGMDLYWGGREIRIRHVADAHTDTDLWVHFPGDNVVHTGDIFFNGGYPFIDTAHGGSIDVCSPTLRIYSARCSTMPIRSAFFSRQPSSTS